MSSRGNAVDRGPTVCARFKVCKALPLTCIGYMYTKLLMILLLRGFKVHIAAFYTLYIKYSVIHFYAVYIILSKNYLKS